MKNDLTTGAWQHDIGCPISITLLSTSDALPSSLTGTLIAVTIALAILAFFLAAITICHMLSSFVVAHHRGRVVALSTLSCQPLPTFIAPVAG
jgi:hypothetical protein